MEKNQIIFADLESSHFALIPDASVDVLNERIDGKGRQKKKHQPSNNTGR